MSRFAVSPYPSTSIFREFVASNSRTVSRPGVGMSSNADKGLNGSRMKILLMGRSGSFGGMRSKAELGTEGKEWFIDATTRHCTGAQVPLTFVSAVEMGMPRGRELAGSRSGTQARACRTFSSAPKSVRA